MTAGPVSFKPFGRDSYDIILLLGTYHKIKRPPTPPLQEMGMRGMNEFELSELMRYLAAHTLNYFAMLGNPTDGMNEFATVDRDMATQGLRRIHTSQISKLGPTAIWRR